MKILVWILGIIAIGLSAWLVGILAFQSPWSEFSEQGAMLTDMIWGRISLVDLYAGFFISLVLVAVLEPKPWVTVLVVLTTPFIGNPVIAIWLVARYKLLREQFRSRASL